MKYYALVCIILFLFSACSSSQNGAKLQTEVDSLQNQLNNAYKPGLGEFMLNIQIHHAKLWFAGTAENWKLANFEIAEIKEAIDNIRQYNSDRSEVKSISIIEPSIDSIDKAITQRDLVAFKNSFVLLTNNCNNCHEATHHEFNVIQVPDTPPFSNQMFKSKN